MSPTIRIDDEVWAWLKSRAVPFEDTPNSVLRRVAGMGTPNAPTVGLTPPQLIDLRVDKARQQAVPPTIIRDQGMRSTPAPVVLQDRGRRITGEWLNKTFHLHAAHALYHKDGQLFERFAQFPGVLCDARGCVRYDTEKDFLADSLLNVGAKVNVSGGLANHPRYEKFPRSSG